MSGQLAARSLIACGQLLDEPVGQRVGEPTDAAGLSGIQAKDGGVAGGEIHRPGHVGFGVLGSRAIAVGNFLHVAYIVEEGGDESFRGQRPRRSLPRKTAAVQQARHRNGRFGDSIG